MYEREQIDAIAILAAFLTGCAFSAWAAVWIEEHGESLTWWTWGMSGLAAISIIGLVWMLCKE